MIYFHDAGCTRAAIAECLRRLKRSTQPFVAYKLPGDTFVVALDTSPVCTDPRVRRMAVAVNGERWLRTAAVSKRARHWVPAALRPALARAVSYTHLRAHETRHDLVCRLLLEK